MNRRISVIIATVAALAVFACAPARGALFRVQTDNGAVVPVGGYVPLIISIIPERGDKVLGGQCTLNVDTEFLELSEDRSKYQADPALKLVENFKVDAKLGIVTFKAKSEEPLKSKKIFIRVPVKMKKAGSTHVSFTSAVLFEDNKRSPSNPGYFQLYGNVGGKEIDPLLYASLVGENTLLTTGSLKNAYSIKRGGASSQASVAAALGITGEQLQVAESEETADVVVEFSKRSATIGLTKNQYVRLDVKISKYPLSQINTLAGFTAMIKFDPKYLQYVNRLGQPAMQVDIQQRLEDMQNPDLEQLAKDYSIEYSVQEFDGTTLKKPEKLKEELVEKIRAVQGDVEDTIFSQPFGGEDAAANLVENSTGKIHLTLALDMSMFVDDELMKDITFPQKVVTLYFKGIKQGRDIPVTMEEMMLGNPDGTQLVHPALITIDPKHEGCGSDLPATLCQGTFTVTGNLALEISKRRESRTATITKTEQVDGESVKSSSEKYVIREKYELAQAWNVWMKGSLRNGIKVDGRIRKQPGVEQSVDLELVTNKGNSAHMGDFNTEFSGTAKANTKVKQITGMEVKYNFGNFDFSTMMAELRSTSGTSTIRGEGTRGPYSIPFGIIPGTLQVFNQKTDKVVTGYTLDPVHNQINFSDIIDTDTVLSLKYEISGFGFTTGNINALGLAYDSKKDTGTANDGLRVKTAYVTSMAPKGEQRTVYQEMETFSTSDLDEQGFWHRCPDEEPELYENPDSISDEVKKAEWQCVRVELRHHYLVEEDSIKLTHGGNTYTENDTDKVILTPRSWYQGWFLVDRREIQGDFTVQYSYYKNTAPQDVILAKQVYPDTELNPPPYNYISISRGSWPDSVISGSERIYFSEDWFGTIENNDLAACYEREYLDTSGLIEYIERDEYSYCYDVLAANRPIQTNYYIETGADETLIYFEDDVPASYKYVIIEYTLAPAELSSSSEFTKTSFGADVNWKMSDSLDFSLQYGMTNSDLSQNYSSFSETIVVDAVTIFNSPDYDYDDYGAKCQYFGTLDVKKMECRLSNKKVKDRGTSFSLQIQFCERDSPDPEDPNYSCKTDDDNAIIYQPEIYTVNYPGDYLVVDGPNGTVSLKRLSEGSIVEDQPFPSEGDKLFVSYLYEETSDKLVQGDSVYMKSTYKRKWITLNMEKENTDPLFDRAASGRLVDGSTKAVESFKYDVTLTPFKNWSFKYADSNANDKQLESGAKEVNQDISNDRNNYSVAYANGNPKRHLQSFSYARNLNTRKGFQGLERETEIDTTSADSHYKFALTVKKGFLTTSGNYKRSTTDNDILKSLSRKGLVQKSLSANFTPWAKLKVNTQFDRENNTTGKRSRTNNYTVTFLPFPLFSFDLKFNRSNVRDSEDQPSKITQNNNYTVKVKPFYRFTDMQFNFTEKKLPPAPNQTRQQRTDSKTLTFKLNIAKPLTWVPKYSVTVNALTQYDRKQAFQWTLNYNPKSRRGFYVKWNQGRTSSQTATLDKDGVASNFSESTTTLNSYETYIKPTGKTALKTNYVVNSSVSNPYDQLTVDFDINPNSKLTIGTYFTKKNAPTNFRKEFRLDTSYYWLVDKEKNRTLKLASNLVRNVSGSGNNDVKSITYNFGANYPLNLTTNLDLSYYQSIRRSDTPGTVSTQNKPNFTARITSNFK